jgi:DNA-binding response OmpR family regulator
MTQEMSGNPVCVRLKKINPDLKVLLISSSPINGEAGDVLRKSCDGFIEKPFNMKRLSTKIREIVDS